MRKISSNNDFEIDSKAAEFSTFVPKIEKSIGRTKPIEEWYMGVSGKWKFRQSI